MTSFYVDIDNTICRTIGNDYEHSIPIRDAIDEINKLYDQGNLITCWTSRGTKSGKNWQDFTKKQLYTWGLKYHHIKFEPKADVIFDDKAILMEDWLAKKSSKIDLLASVIADTVRYKTKVLIAGNGGLAAESSHFAAELVGKYGFDVYIPCLSLVDCNPLLTAVSNDFSYAEVFSHQLKVLGNQDDIFIGMTTSKSPNILKALAEARKKGLITVVLCGTKYTEFTADYVFPINGNDTAEIQENLLKFLHKVAYKSKEKLIGVK